MDQVLGFVFTLLPFFHVLIIAVVIAKVVLMTKYKGFDLPGYIFSFFRLYKKREYNFTKNKKRVTYMKINNALNYYFYFWLFVCALFLIISHSNPNV